MSKITEKQLENLNKKYSAVQQLKVYIGDIEGQKHLLLHQLVNAQDELQKMQATLEEEYGKVSIDLKDGTYTPIEKE
jgi:hypothetical protein